MKLTTELSHGKHVVKSQIKLSSECTIKGNKIETVKIVTCTSVYKPLDQNFTCFYLVEVVESTIFQEKPANQSGNWRRECEVSLLQELIKHIVASWHEQTGCHSYSLKLEILINTLNS